MVIESSLSESACNSKMELGAVKAELCSEGRCSNTRAVFNILLSAIGLGIVQLPSVFARLGWLGGILVLVIACVAVNFTLQKFIYFIANAQGGKTINTYEDAGEVAFGMPGRWATAFVVHVTMTGCSAVLLLLVGQNLSKLFPSLSTDYWVLIAGLVSCPALWLRTLHEVSYVAAVGVAGVFALVAVIMVACIWRMSDSRGSEALPAEAVESASYSMVSGSAMVLFSSLGSTMLSFNVANVAPTLRRDMKNPAAFPRVSVIAYAVIFGIYLLIASSGYGAYGEALLDRPDLTIVDWISPPSAPLSVLGYLCISATLVMAVPHYVVVLMPVCQSVDYCVPQRVQQLGGIYERVFIIVGRSLLVLLTGLVAVFVPSVSDLIDLIGSVTMVNICLLLPLGFYYRLRWMQRSADLQLGRGQSQTRTVVDLLVSGVLFVVGLGVLSIGSAGAVVSWLNNK